MKEYVIEVTETLQRQVYIYADNENEAIEKVQEKYYNDDIVLDYNDFEEVNFGVVGGF